MPVFKEKQALLKIFFTKKNDDPACDTKSSFYSFFNTVMVPFSTNVTNNSAS